MYLKVKDKPYLVRDTRSKALLNTNRESLNNYKRERENRIRMAKLVNEHDELMSRMDNIEKTLALILEKL